jgi:hypothetical protein
MKLRMLVFAAGATLAVAAPAAEGATNASRSCAAAAQALGSQSALSASLRLPLSATAMQSPARVWQTTKNTRDALYWALAQSGKRCR